MSSFAKPHNEGVKRVLPHNSRFILRDGKMIVINKVDRNKQRELEFALKKKPKIDYIITSCSGCDPWDLYSVKFSNGSGINYNVGYLKMRDVVCYVFGHHSENTFTPKAHLFFH
jgi:ribosomal protein L36